MSNKYERHYLYKVRWVAAITAFMVFMTHGSLLFSQRFGIDTDIIMEGLHQFDILGRQGLVWLQNLLGMGLFNLYYAQILTILFLILAPLAFGYLFAKMSNTTEQELPRHNLGLAAFSCAFVISPFWVTQVYFLNQSAQVLVACTLIPIAILLVESAKELKKKWYCLLSALLLQQVIFASYQILILLYVTAVAAAFVLHCLKHTSQFKEQLRWLGQQAGAFLVGFLIYTLISRAFFLQDAHYLKNQIGWTYLDFGDVLFRCFYGILDTLKKIPPYHTGLYALFVLALLLLTICRLRSTGILKKLSGILLLLAELFVMTAPQILILMYGGEVMDRMQLILPFSQGFLFYLTLQLLPQRKKAITSRQNTESGMKIPEAGTPQKLIAKILGLILLLAFCKDTLTRMDYCSRLYYTDQWVYDYDTKIAEKLYLDITAAQSNHEEDAFADNIVFVGNPEIPYNSTCIRGEMIGCSVFCFEHKMDNIGDNRLLFFMRDLGYPLNIYFSEGEKAAFHAYFRDSFADTVDDMPSYPAPGYVQYLTEEELGLEYLVVKLGDDWHFRSWAE